MDTRLALIHETADVDETATIGAGTQIWNYAQVREGAVIGANCNIGSGAYIGVGVHIGDNCKILNNACIFKGAIVDDGVFIGPGCVIGNDKYPRAVDSDGKQVEPGEWRVWHTHIHSGASLGANSTVIPGLTVAAGAEIGAGAVLTKDALPYTLYVGNPAKEMGNAY